MEFDVALSRWYLVHRRDLPWRKDPSPYEVWISEIMLQQTRVEKVKEYYVRFLKRYPDVFALARAQEKEVLKMWEGLGYYSRARNLLALAKIVVERFEGAFPSDEKTLLSLPGVGAYTACAIRAIAFHKKEVAVDGNLIRVYARLRADGEETLQKVKERAREYFLQAMGREDPSAFNQALMDLGELVCLPLGAPRCDRCPLAAFCKARERGNPQSYPAQKKRKGKREVSLTVFALVYKGRIAVCQRPKTGLLASLYELPNAFESLSEEEVEKRYPQSLVLPLGDHRHVFTHLAWNMKGYLVLLKEKEEGHGFSWKLPESVRKTLALPQAFLIYLQRAEETLRSRSFPHHQSKTPGPCPAK